MSLISIAFSLSISLSQAFADETGAGATTTSTTASESSPSASAVVDTDEGTWMNLDVSPDGEEIVFDLLGDLFVLPIDGGEAKPLTSGPAWDVHPRFSPDGQSIAFISDREGADNLWVVSRNSGTARQVSHETLDLVSNPCWSPDGESHRTPITPGSMRTAALTVPQNSSDSGGSDMSYKY